MALNITDRDRQLAMLLHYMGEHVHDIYGTLDHTLAVHVVNGVDVTEDRFHQTVRVLAEHFNPRINKEYSVYVFRQAKQADGETINQFTQIDCSLKNMRVYHV